MSVVGFSEPGARAIAAGGPASSTPTPTPTPSATPVISTPTSSPSPIPVINIVAKVTQSKKGGSTFPPGNLIEPITKFINEGGSIAKPPVGVILAVTQRKTTPLLLAEYDVDAATVTLTLLTPDGPDQQYTVGVKNPFDPYQLAPQVLAISRQVANGMVTPAPKATLFPNHLYNVVIVPDVQLSDASDPQAATTSFSGSTYFESRLRVDLLKWQLTAATAGDYFKDLSGSQTAQIPTTVPDTIRELCTIQPSLVILRYTLSYSETQQEFFGSQQGYATLDAWEFQCPGTFDWFLNTASANAPKYSAANDPSNRWYLGRHTFTIHRRNSTTKGAIFPILLTAINFGLTRARVDAHSFLGAGGPIVAGSFIQNPDSNAAVTQAVGEASRYLACSTFLDVTAVSAPPVLQIVNDDRDRAPCPTAQLVLDARSIESPNAAYSPMKQPFYNSIFTAVSTPRPSPSAIPTTTPSPFNRLFIPASYPSATPSPAPKPS